MGIEVLYEELGEGRLAKGLEDVELTLLDGEFKRFRVVRDFISMQWTERYYEGGEFELLLPEKYAGDAMKAFYVARKGRVSVGVIETFEQSGDGVLIRGGFLDVLLKKRVLNGILRCEGPVHDVCRETVKDFCIDAGSRKIARLALGEFDVIDRCVSMQQRGITVDEVLRSVLTPQEAGYRLRHEADENVIYFDVFKGRDRTPLQSKNNWCVFSRDFRNILEESYELGADNRNVAYVAGEEPVNKESYASEGFWYEFDGSAGVYKKTEVKASDNNQTVVCVDLSGESLERSELYVDARDIRKTEGMSEEQYKALLRERGEQKLAEYNQGECVACSVDWTKMGNMPFALGDKCAYVNNYAQITLYERITEIREVVENSGISVDIILGKETLTLDSKIKRKLS